MGYNKTKSSRYIILNIRGREMKITLLEPLGIASEVLEHITKKIREAGHEFISYSDRVEDKHILIERTADSDAVILTNLPYPKEVIEACSNLKYINVAFTGVDHVDTAYCKERGITISNASGYSDIAVAELAFGMMLNLSRFINEGNQATREGKTKAGLIGTELYGKKLGVIGCGHIGQRVIEIAKAFGCEVVVYSRSIKPELEAKGVKFVTLETLMRESDIVTLHIPQNSETIGLIDAEKIGLMKQTALLINTARGPIVDSKALAEALKSGSIAGVGIDVFETEPPIEGTHPLLNCSNTLVTPHVAFATKEALERRAEIVLDNMLAWLNGEIKNKVV